MAKAKFIEGVCSLRGMNKDESKIKLGIDCDKSFLDVSLKATDDYCVKPSPSGPAFRLSCAKRIMKEAPETQLNLLEIVSSIQITEIVHYTCTGDLKIADLMTGIGSNASTHPCANCISSCKSWDLDAP